MKLAEALQERAELNRRIEQIKSRLSSNANDALPLGLHKLDFSSTSGTLAGRVTVRVSDVNQSY